VASNGGRALVIVESPTKARTIRKFLGDDYIVEASMGHVRDLPSSAAEIPASVKGESWARLAVDVDNDYQPVYVVPADKKKIVASLKKQLKECDVLYLATDEDREGESIGWHLLELLKPKVPTHRMVFHEITREAIERALASPREVNEQLVKAQEARRVLDRLVGYTVSPLLWKKVAPRLSAGRVQSVAVRLLVLRERERMAFVAGAWWDLKAQLLKKQTAFAAQLIAIDEKRVASGGDFHENTGQLKPGRDVRLIDEAEARALAARIEGLPLNVVALERKESQRNPYPPFTTSTLQQEANRKLGLPARQTMQVAQKLYESGHITYMRTDSVNLSNEAIGAVRAMIERRYGSDLLSPKVRQFTTKSKGAQEAHEAIRPAGTDMRTAQELGLKGREAAVYELIWKRTVATQMANARLASTTARLEVTDPETGAVIRFRASGREVIFPGFFRAYVEGTDDPSQALDDKDNPLPQLVEGESLAVSIYDALGHETRPPARYTEASLVKALETQGIGRPSTYASIIDTIQKRGYVRANGRQMVPTFTAMAVTKLLEETLGEVINVEFTASMETWLDAIAEGGERLSFLDKFYKTDLVGGVAAGELINPREVCTIKGERYAPYNVRLGRYGPYVEYPGVEEGDKSRSVSLPDDIAPADVDRALVEALIERTAKGELPLGTQAETDLPVFVRVGRFGPYVQLGEVTEEAPKPKRASLPPGVTVDQIDLELALAVLALPRKLGEHPDDGEAVSAGIGRYGPYVVHKRTYASLKKTDDVLAVELPRALELITEKLTRAGRRAEPLRTLGAHPEDGEPVVVLDGRYGPYVKHLRINASLTEGMTVETLTMEEAVALIAARAAKTKTKAKRKTKAKTKRKSKAKAKTKRKSKAKAKTKSKAKSKTKSKAKSKTKAKAKSKTKAKAKAKSKSKAKAKSKTKAKAKSKTKAKAKSKSKAKAKSKAKPKA
jgi:DNA topoisomerase I